MRYRTTLNRDREVGLVIDELGVPLKGVAFFFGIERTVVNPCDADLRTRYVIDDRFEPFVHYGEVLNVRRKS